MTLIIISLKIKYPNQKHQCSSIDFISFHSYINQYRYINKYNSYNKIKKKCPTVLYTSDFIILFLNTPIFLFRHVQIRNTIHYYQINRQTDRITNKCDKDNNNC